MVALVHDLPEKDHTAEIERLVEHARQGIRYVRDPWAPGGLELFIDPRTMLRDVERGTATGDCDDHVLLASALLEVAGYPTRYVVGGAAPGAYRHIWLEVGHPKRGWLPIEMTKKDWPVGRDPSGKFPVVETHLGDGDDMIGLGQVRTGLSRSALRRRLAAPIARQRRRMVRGGRARSRRGARASIRSSLEPRRIGRIDLRRRDREIGRRRRGRGRRRGQRWSTHGLGDLQAFDVPPSFFNVQHDTQLYAGATPSDFFRATEIRSMADEHTPLRYSPLLGLEDYLEDWDDASADRGWTHVWQEDELGGFFKKIVRAPVKVAKRTAKRSRRATKRSAVRLRRRSKRLAKTVAASKVGRGLKKGVQRYGPEVLAVAGTIAAGPAAGAALYGATAAVRQNYLAKKAAARGDLPPQVFHKPLPTTVANKPVAPVIPPLASVQPGALASGPSIPTSLMSTEPGPSFVQAAEGFALPPDAPDQVAVEDQGQGGVQADREWLEPLPGAGVGSWIPEPPLDEFPNAPPIEPFDTPADGVDGGDYFPGFGMGYGTAPWFSSESQIDAAATFGLGDDMENSATQIGFGTLGAESWITQLARAAGQTAIAYGQARLGKRYGQIPVPPPVGAFLSPPVPPPAPRAPAVARAMSPRAAGVFTRMGQRRNLAVAGAVLLGLFLLRRR